MNESFQNSNEKSLPPESIEKALLPKELFALQVQFAHEVAVARDMSLADALMQYTSIHARLFHHPNKGIADDWVNFVETLPTEPEAITDVIYNAYTAKEEAKSHESHAESNTYGCFSQQYQEAINTFILHFGNNDSQGNLGKNRVKARLEDLQELTTAIEVAGKDGASVQMSSWLLSVEAFNRLLPPVFVEAIKDIELDAAQDNGLWGQFLDKEGRVKADLAEQLLENIKDEEASVMDSFPCKLRTAKVPQEVFFNQYL